MRVASPDKLADGVDDEEAAGIIREAEEAIGALEASRRELQERVGGMAKCR